MIHMAKWGRLAFFYRHPCKSKKKPCLRELCYSLVTSKSVQQRRIQLPRSRNFISHQIRISNIKSKLARERNSQNPLYVSSPRLELSKILNFNFNSNCQSPNSLNLQNPKNSHTNFVSINFNF